jgi:hypothetical protein
VCKSPYPFFEIRAQGEIPEDRASRQRRQACRTRVAGFIEDTLVQQFDPSPPPVARRGIEHGLYDSGELRVLKRGNWMADPFRQIGP